MIALLGTALASSVVAPTVVSDLASGARFVGLDLQFVADDPEGTHMVGRLSGGPDLLDGGPVLVGEVGFVTTVPAEESAVIRVGLLARGIRISRDLPVPFERSGAVDGEIRGGLVPSGIGFAELMWTPEAPAVLGGQVGFGLWGGTLPECFDPDEPQVVGTCVEWPVGFTAAVYGRKTFRNGLVLYGSAGVHTRVGVGWVLHRKKQ